MTTPTGTISATSINEELGQSSTTQLSLNASNVRALAGILSGQISYDDLRGRSAVELTLLESTYTAYATYQSQAVCGFRLNSDGDVETGVNGIYQFRYNWVTPSSSASDYQVRASVVETNDVVVGTLNSWLDLTSTRGWSVSQDYVDGEPFYAVLNIQIRRVDTTTVLKSENITIRAFKLDIQ